MAKTLKKSMKKPHRKISRQKRRTQKRGGEVGRGDIASLKALEALEAKINVSSGGGEHEDAAANHEAWKRTFPIWKDTVQILTFLKIAINKNKCLIVQDEILKSTSNMIEDISERTPAQLTNKDIIESDIKLVRRQTLNLLKIISG